MLPTERRQRLRAQLAKTECIQPASVFDPLSARMAERLGFETAVLAGSVASAVAVGAPDVGVITLTELADTARRITRASDLGLVVDADHGYGNALNVRRTVRELEDAGVSALTIEDTALPQAYGTTGERLISTEEAQGKLRAALDGRQDAATVIVGRTHAMRGEGLDGAAARTRAYASCGVDALFLVGVTTLAEVEALAEAAGGLPLVLGNPPASLDDASLTARGVRLAFRGHPAFQAMVQAVREGLEAQAGLRDPADLAGRLAAPELIAEATAAADHARWAEEFLR